MYKYGEDQTSNFGGEQPRSGNCAVNSLQCDDRRSFGMLAFENRLK